MFKLNSIAPNLETFKFLNVFKNVLFSVIRNRPKTPNNLQMYIVHLINEKRI